MAVLIVDHNTILSESARKPAAYGEPDVEITAHKPDPKLIDAQRQKLASNKGLTDLTGLFFDIARIRTNAGVEMSLRICAMDSRASSGFNAYRVEKGQDLDFKGFPGILVSRKVAEKLGIIPGDVVRMWLDRPVPNICKDGKIVPMFKKDRRKQPPATDFTINGILSNENLGLERIAIIPFTQGLALAEGGYLNPIFWAKVAPGHDLPSIKESLKDSFKVDKPHKRAMIGRSPEENAFRNGVRICAILSLLLGLYIIFNSMSMSLVERVRQIGLLRAMGITRAGLTFLFLVEGFILTILGCIMATGITALIVYFMAKENITTIGAGHPLEITQIPWIQLIGVMVLGIVFALLGIIYPVGKASSLSVIQAIRKGVIEFERQPFKGIGRILFFFLILMIPLVYFIISPILDGRRLEAFIMVIYMGILVTIVMGLLLFFPSLLNKAASLVITPLRPIYKVCSRLAQNSMNTSRLRVFSTVSGLALVFAAIFVITAVTDSLENEMITWSDKNMVSNIYIRGASPGLITDDELKKIDGVQAVMNLSANINAPFPVRGVDTNAILSFGPFKGRTDLADRLKKEDWIIISDRLSKIYNYKTNDIICLSSPLAGKRSFTIWAISDEYGFYPDDRSFAVISMENMEHYFCVTATQGLKWSLHMDDGASPHEIKNRLATLLNERGEITAGIEIKEEYVTDLNASFNIFKIIISLVALLSGVSILNSLVIAVIEQRRGAALLRVVGLTPNQLKGILLMEAFSLGTLGGVFGLILGAPIVVLSVQGIRKLSELNLEVTFRWETMLLTLFGAIIISIAAAIYPILRQGSTDLMEAVKFE